MNKTKNEEEQLCQRMLDCLGLRLAWDPDLNMFFFIDNTENTFAIPNASSTAVLQSEYSRFSRPASVSECFHMLCNLYDSFNVRMKLLMPYSKLPVPESRKTVINPFFNKSLDEVQIMLDLLETNIA